MSKKTTYVVTYKNRTTTDNDAAYYYAPYVPLMRIHFIFVGLYLPRDWKAYILSIDAVDWITSQPKDMWIKIDDDLTGYSKNVYAMNKELESWMKLKYE